MKKWRQLLIPGPAGGGDPPPTPRLMNGRTSLADSTNSRLSPAGFKTSSPALPPRKTHSSLPSSASTSPLSSRPTTPAPPTLSPTNGVSDGVSKTIVANKRLRKDVEPVAAENEPPAKRTRSSQGVNGVNNGKTSEFLLDTDTRDSFISVISDTSSVKVPTVTPATVEQPQPPTSKRPRRGQTRNQPQRPDVLEQQMQFLRKGTGKVRTTQELVEELALRSQSPGLTSRAATLNAASIIPPSEETKSQLMERFFESQENVTAVMSPPLSRAASPAASNVGSAAAPTTEGKAETVEEVLAQLPPINVEEILRSMEEEFYDEDIEGLIPVKKPEVEVTDDLIDKLNNGQEESLNGNFNHDGQFREWHEVVSKETKDGDLLYILPYSIIE